MIFQSEILGQNYLKMYLVKHDMKIYKFHKDILISKQVPIHANYINGNERIIHSCNQDYHAIHINESNQTKYIKFFKHNYYPLLVNHNKHQFQGIKTILIYVYIFCFTHEVMFYLRMIHSFTIK